MYRFYQGFSGLITPDTGKEYPYIHSGRRRYCQGGDVTIRSWATKLKGTLQMDMSYATIHVFVQQRQVVLHMTCPFVKFILAFHPRI